VKHDGERVHDEHLNRLTVIASEDYEAFAAALQTEYEHDLGIKFGRVARDAFSKVTRTGANGVEEEIGRDVSARIWNDLVHRQYLNADGDIQKLFDPDSPSFRLATSDEFSDLQGVIVDELRKYLFSTRIANAHKRRELVFHKRVHLRDDFRELWNRIGQRTRYRVRFETRDLIEAAGARVREMGAVAELSVASTRVALEVTHAGVKADQKWEEKRETLAAPDCLPDVVSFLQNETDLTRHTIIEILRECERIGDFRRNPQEFMTAAAREVSAALHDLVLAGIQYEKIEGEVWEMQRIEREAEKGITRYLKDLYDVRNADKSLFDAIAFESEVERRFAADLDSNEHVRLFVKLPGWFQIDTPIGPYNPDWAIVTEREERLYFVRETKSTLDAAERRVRENQKLECGRRHFNAIGTDFDVVTSLSEVEF